MLRYPSCTSIFAAGRNDADLGSFAVKVLENNIIVVNKYDLLYDNDLREPYNFLWD
jgi:hypothetical protein